MIIALLKEELRKRGLSARGAAMEIGIAHTTVIRILEGSPVDLETLRKVCSWLNVDVATILNTPDANEKSLVEKFACILQKNPALRGLFDEYYDKMEHSEVSLVDLEEIIAFMIFRSYYKKP